MTGIEVLIFFIKPMAIYLAALAVVRLMGKRALGELSLFDLVVMAGIGDVIVVVGLEQQISFFRGLMILGVLAGMELLFSFLSYRFRSLAKILEGKPTLLIKDGMVIQKNLMREHVSLWDLRQELRKKGVARVEDVSRAMLEACGKFSVIVAKDSEQFDESQLQAELAALRREIVELKEMLQLQKEN